MADSIKCPECRAEIPLSDVISHQIQEQLAPELAEEREKLDLEIARRLDGERKKIAAATRQQATEHHQLELRQKELAIEQMQRQITELKESSEQARAGLIGEAQEREIEDVLTERFRSDRIEPIKAGVRGADVIQTVVSRRGE